MVQCPICVDHLVLRALLSTGPQTERPGGAYTFPGWPQPGTTFVGRILIRGRSGQDWLPQMSRFFEWSGPINAATGFERLPGERQRRYGAVWRAPYSRPPGGSRAPVRDKIGRAAWRET